MEDFEDYYELMQISPHAEFNTIQRIYRLLAARYHPDNSETGSMEKFVKLQKAYEVLSDAEKRAEYDVQWQAQCTRPMPIFEMKEFIIGIDAEVNRRLGVLCLLYNRRKTNPEQPGLSLLDMEHRMSMPREHLEFTVWYLRDKDLARRDERSSEIVITAEGVDYVERQLTSNEIVYKLLKPAEGEGPWAATDSGTLKSRTRSTEG